MQHIRPLCPSPSAKVCPSSCPLHWRSHPAISSSNALFSFCPQSFPASGTFPMSQLFASDLPKYWSFSIIISPSSEYSGLIFLKIDWFVPGSGTKKWNKTKQKMGLISCCPRDFQESSPAPQLKASVVRHSTFFMVQLSQSCDPWEDHSLDCTDLCWQSNVPAFQHTV